MNSTSDTYRMDPSEDTLVYGDELEEGMWVLAESIGQRTPRGDSEDDQIRSQRFRRVSRLHRAPGSAVTGSPVLVHFIGTWIDGYCLTHTSNLGMPWIVKKAPADAKAIAEAEVIARICASGYDEHVRLHGPDGDRAEAPTGGTFTVVRGGRAYTVTVTPAGMAAEGEG